MPNKTPSKRSSRREAFPSVIISNGSEFFEIDAADLEGARADGFYLPREREMTVVSNGSEVFEVSVKDVEAAKQDGFRDLVEDLETRHRQESMGRRRKKSRPAKTMIAGLPVIAVVDPKLVAINTGDESSTFDLDSFDLPAQSNEETILTPVSIATDDEFEQSELPSVEGIDLEEILDEDAEYRREIREKLDDASGVEKLSLMVQLYSPSRDQVEKASRSYGTSVILHIVVLLLLSFILLGTDEPQAGATIISSIVSTENDIAEDTEEVEMEIEMEETEVTEMAETEASDLAGELSEAPGLQSNSLTSSFDVSGLGGGAEGLDKSVGQPAKANASFFGSKQVASRFVFIIDNSMSMTKGRFETALNELAKTITRLTPQQSYYIIFYSDTAYGLFHPYQHRSLVPATPRNKNLTMQWLTTVQLCLRTNGAKAMGMAYQLSPDVIFVLGDGAFSDNAKVLSLMNGRSEAARKIPIHTLGMEVDANAASRLRHLSEISQGTYNDVGVHAQAAIMAKQTPRRTNKKRGPIWGITLPP